MTRWTWILLVGWPLLAFVLAGLLGPTIGAHMAGRRMTPAERDQTGWAAAGLVVGVVIACLLIGGWWR